MTAPARRNARAALDAARSAVGRLDPMRGSEDLAADMIESWSAVETALRSLVGGSTLSGQALIREARQRQLINFDQANAIAEFQAARDRLERADYRPTETDINAARAAFLKLDTGVTTDDQGSPAASSGTPATPLRETTTLNAASSSANEPLPAAGRGIPAWAVLLAMVVVLAGIAAAGYYALAGRNTNTALQRGVQDYNSGQREAAVGEFNKAVRDDPKSATPHIYLARMAREVGNYSMATQELQLALEAEPNNALALREMGANLFTQGNYDLARRFYVRAVQTDPTDKSALGYLGCALVRLGRPAEAATFLNRAGPGAWSTCATSPPGVPGAVGNQPRP